MAENLGRFGHHPDTVTDFEVEVDALGGMAADADRGLIAKGMHLGAPKKVTPAMAREMKRLRKTMTTAQIAKKFDVSPGTVAKYAPKPKKR